MKLLMIDGISYDDNVITKSYSVQKENEYSGTEYQDGWWKKHRTITRTRINGTCTLSFKSASTYNAFVKHLQESTDTEGDHTVALYVNSSNKIETITAYINYTTKTAISTPAFGHTPVFWAVELTIEER